MSRSNSSLEYSFNVFISRSRLVLFVSGIYLNSTLAYSIMTGWSSFFDSSCYCCFFLVAGILLPCGCEMTYAPALTKGDWSWWTTSEQNMRSEMRKDLQFFDLAKFSIYNYYCVFLGIDSSSICFLLIISSKEFISVFLLELYWSFDKWLESWPNFAAILFRIAISAFDRPNPSYLLIFI